MINNKEIIRFTIPLLLKCNLDCSYCHVPNDRNEYLDYEIFKKSLIFFFETEWKQKDLVLYWWEPLLLWEKKLEEYINILNNIKYKYKNKDINVTMVTNLTILNEKLETLLENIDSIAVSIDWKEKSHNWNRGLFKNTYNNLLHLQENIKLKEKLSINKVVNKNNSYTFYEDVKYLIETFNIELYYNWVLTVSDWDDKSVEELNIQLKQIYQYWEKNNILSKLWNFFKIPLNWCPFWTLSLSLDWKIYNCEFMANDYINKQWYVIDLKKNTLNLDIKDCSYNLTSKRCLGEMCMWCWKFCTKFSFQEWKFLDKKWESLLKKVKNIRFNHLDKYEKEIDEKLDWILNIEFNNIDLKWVFKLYNFLYSLEHMLSIKDFNIILKSKKSKILKLLLNKLILKWKTRFNINILENLNSYNIKVDIKSSYAYNNKNAFIWNINSEIKYFL
jgi:sulfatase maturation enzyme AslB (radical SAM superfamily)